jgi:excisionase family DNA binding protein
MPDEIMTPEEMAEYLGFSVRKVYRKVRSGELLGARIGRLIRFQRELVDMWLRLKASRWTERQRQEYRVWAEHYSAEFGVPVEELLDPSAARERQREAWRQLHPAMAEDPSGEG